MTLSTADARLLARWLDGELPGAAGAAFAARVAGEPGLAAACAAERRRRELVAAAAAVPTPRARPGFTSGVLAAVRAAGPVPRTPDADPELLVSFCRRILLAAAVLAVVGLAWQFGWLQAGGARGGQAPATLQAAPDTVQREMERLDALLRAEEGAASPARHK